MSVVWSVILARINAVSMSLQNKQIELISAVNLLKSLLDFLIAKRENFDYYLTKANEIIDTEKKNTMKEMQKMLCLEDKINLK